MDQKHITCPYADEMKRRIMITMYRSEFGGNRKKHFNDKIKSNSFQKRENKRQKLAATKYSTPNISESLERLGSSPFTCGSCGAAGHTRASSICPNKNAHSQNIDRDPCLEIQEPTSTPISFVPANSIDIHVQSSTWNPGYGRPEALRESLMGFNKAP